MRAGTINSLFLLSCLMSYFAEIMVGEDYDFDKKIYWNKEFLLKKMNEQWLYEKVLSDRDFIFHKEFSQRKSLK